MNIQIVYSSSHGQTKKIAKFLHTQFYKDQEENHSVELLEISPQNISQSLPYKTDLVIIGAPVYMGNFPKHLLRWAQLHKEELRIKQLAFFTVSLNNADKRTSARKMDNELLRKLIQFVGLVPQYVASFSGALTYLNYGPITRFIMKKISQRADGPTDTSRNYEMTDWEQVRDFTSAIKNQDKDSAFVTRNRFSESHHMDYFMPEFEQVWRAEIEIPSSLQEIMRAFKKLTVNEMPIASMLVFIRTLGQTPKVLEGETFMEAAETFGNALLHESPNELIAGLVGRFWQLDFGIKKILAREFKNFNEADYAKVACGFLVIPDQERHAYKVIVEMRVHGTSKAAQDKFATYWMWFGPGIKIYMRSVLCALCHRALSIETKIAPTLLDSKKQ